MCSSEKSLNFASAALRRKTTIQHFQLRFCSTTIQLDCMEGILHFVTHNASLRSLELEKKERRGNAFEIALLILKAAEKNSAVKVLSLGKGFEEVFSSGRVKFSTTLTEGFHFQLVGGIRRRPPFNPLH
ncbi:expressed unknown protein [Seminavis robusta]|uniref:Uncharacterized protein n=1 Tax=Seminavis robusta TaxID=568900 RepID=A0A9N8EU38_9STRA|nr:expressed unknown protein [Seminavis robusta]|eukprot:Sro1630_g287190.1 n/a (129) ;mRNA; r:18119-18505